jgi:hypothetical protein
MKLFEAEAIIVEWKRRGHGKRLPKRDRGMLAIIVQAAFRQVEARGVMRALDVTCCGHWRCPEVSRTRELARKIEIGHPDVPATTQHDEKVTK